VPCCQRVRSPAMHSPGRMPCAALPCLCCPHKHAAHELACPTCPQLKESQPTLTLGEIGKATGEAWGKLSDKVRCGVCRAWPHELGQWRDCSAAGEGGRLGHGHRRCALSPCSVCSCSRLAAAVIWWAAQLPFQWLKGLAACLLAWAPDER